jgi:hypothetical protein
LFNNSAPGAVSIVSFMQSRKKWIWNPRRFVFDLHILWNRFRMIATGQDFSANVSSGDPGTRPMFPIHLSLSNSDTFAWKAPFDPPPATQPDDICRPRCSKDYFSCLWRSLGNFVARHLLRHGLDFHHISPQRATLSWFIDNFKGIPRNSSERDTNSGVSLSGFVW